MSHLSDIEIAQAKKLAHVITIAKKLGVKEDDIEMYGKYKAKLPLHLIDEEKAANNNLILVTALTPTPAGEGKTTVSIGLTEGLNKIGKQAAFSSSKRCNGSLALYLPYISMSSSSTPILCAIVITCLSSLACAISMSDGWLIIYDMVLLLVANRLLKAGKYT